LTRYKNILDGNDKVKFSLRTLEEDNGITQVMLEDAAYYPRSSIEAEKDKF